MLLIQELELELLYFYLVNCDGRLNISGPREASLWQNECWSSLTLILIRTAICFLFFQGTNSWIFSSRNLLYGWIRNRVNIFLSKNFFLLIKVITKIIKRQTTRDINPGIEIRIIIFFTCSTVAFWMLVISGCSTASGNKLVRLVDRFLLAAVVEATLIPGLTTFTLCASPPSTGWATASGNKLLPMNG